MHGLVRCKLERRCWRSHGEDVLFTNVKIKIQGPGDVNDVMHRKRARKILGVWKKSVSWVLPRRKKVDFRSLAEALYRVPRALGGGADGKASKERLCLSPYIEKPFNSKVIKSFVLKLRSRKCFSCFEIPMFYVYMLWTFYVRFTYPDIWLCYTYILDI